MAEAGSEERVLPTQRRTTIIAILVTVPVALLVWWAAFQLPPIEGMEDTADRFGFAFALIAAAVLFTLVLGVEAIAHERLVTPAIDPLAGHETRRMRVNHRYLQNTLEQTIVFAAGLLMLAWLVDDGAGMRALVAATIVWVLARWGFWVGYHRSPLLRGWGAAGMLQSMLILLYGTFRFGEAYGGLGGGLAPILLFLAIEAWLFIWTARPQPNALGASQRLE